jgi:nicotinate-nucleotide adenylyltransferase
MGRGRTIAVYGGSFQPPHVGHAMVAAWLRWTGLADEVWLVPVGAHAFGKALWPFAERVALCQAMADDVGAFVRVCEVEGELEGVSYTVRTLDALAARWPDDRFRWVMGADQWAVRASWHAWDRLEASYAPIVVGRAGFGDVADAPTFPDVRSTALRERLARGEDLGGWVTSSVARRLAAGGWRGQGASPITP